MSAEEHPIAEPEPGASAVDPGRQRRARIALVALLILVVGGGASGYFGWRAYQAHEEAKLAAAIEAEGGLNTGRRRATFEPRHGAIAAAAQKYTDEMARRQQQQQQQRLQELEAALAEYKKLPEPQREAFVQSTVASNVTRWRQIANNPLKSQDPEADAFIAKLKTAIQRSGNVRPAATRPATAPPARPRPATVP